MEHIADYMNIDLLNFSDALDEKDKKQRLAEIEKANRHRFLIANGHAGFRIGPDVIKHRNIEPKYARTGNLVILETRKSGDHESCIQGPWEKEYMLGVVKSRPEASKRTAAAKTAKASNSAVTSNPTDNLDEDLINIEMYEPYHVKDGLPSIPLWAHLEKENIDYADEYDWEKLISLPWLPITKMRVSVHMALCKFNNIPYAPQDPKKVDPDFAGTGVRTEIDMKPYATQQYCGTIKFICSLGKNEKGKGSEGLTFNAETKQELAFVLRQAEIESM